MRNYSWKMKKSYKRGGSRRLRGGNRFLNFFGIDKPSVTPEDAQAQQVAAAQDDEVAGLQQMTESKQQQASTLRDQCTDYKRRADQLDQEAAEHMNATAEIARNREAKNRCDQEHAMRLQGIEQEYQQILDQLTQQHNTALAQENQRAQEQHVQCLREGMRLSNAPIAAAQQQRDDDMNAAAATLQAQRRGQLDRRSTMGPTAARAADPLIGAIGGRKSRCGGVHCGSHKKKKYGSRKSRRRSRKSRRRSRKSRRGGVHYGSHKKKMYGGRRSRRGGTKCSPKSGKKCSYYKKYGYHHHM
jgi:hypothetical protein